MTPRATRYRALVLGAFGLSAALTGLIWTVQLVQYPLLAAVGTEHFEAYHAGHSQRIAWIVVPAMLTEVALALGLIVQGRGWVPTWWLASGTVLLAIVWLSTFGLQVPAHAVLSAGFDRSTWEMLVSTNWIRTGAWSVRTLVLGWWLANERASP